MRMPDVSSLWRSLRGRGIDENLLPFELVKYFAFTSFLFILGATFVLSWMIAKNANAVLLERSKAYSQLFADNINRQVFLQFVMPTVLRYGQISLSNESQYERLDLIVKNITRGMHIDSVTIFDFKENIVAYSTIPELMGKRGLGGPEYLRAVGGETSSVVISTGSLLNLIPGYGEIIYRLKTYVPFRQENRLAEHSGEIMGVIEVTQDLSENLKAIIVLQGKVMLMSLLIMSLLFALLSLIVVKANRIMARRAEERLRLEEQLNEAQRLASLGKMVASVSHEIKNPLGIVRSTAEILAKRIEALAPGNERLAGIIIEETTRLDTIVREFLDFARPRRAQMQRHSLNAVIERVLRFLDSEFTRKSIALDSVLAADLPEIVMDAEHLHQVALNIVFNAIQAMPDGGMLSLRTVLDAEQERVFLTITDTGEGIAAEKLEQIFTPFYTDKNRGTGLGLAIAKSIIEKHHGAISVQSQPGAGSVFTIILPISQPAPDSASAQ